MAVTQTASELTMVDKLAEIKKLVGDADATENPMAFYDYIVEAMKGRPVDDSFRRDLEGFRHNIEWSLYLNRFVVATFEGSPDADQGRSGPAFDRTRWEARRRQRTCSGRPRTSPRRLS